MDNETGKPPKSNEQIREKLASMHKSANVEKHSGPMKNGFSKHHKILIATFYSRKLATRLQRILGEHGIFSDDECKQRRTSIKVDYEDSDKAAELAQQFQLLNPEPIPASEKRRFEGAAFGVLITGTIAMCFLDRTLDFADGLAFILISASIGLLLGNLVDRLRGTFGPNAKQMGMWELLNVVALVGLFILLAQIVPTIFKAWF